MLGNISRADLRAELRKDLAGRGFAFDSETGVVTGDGPLPEKFPTICGGNYEIVSPPRMMSIMEEAQALLDTLERVKLIFDCKEYAEVASALAAMYPIMRKPGAQMRCEWLGLKARYAIGQVASGHAQCLVYTTEGTMFWEPQAGGGLLLPQPYAVRPGHWGIWAGWF
jgi:hypothetical protein